MIELDDVLKRLVDVRKSSGGYICRCPSHDDRHPSLSIKQAEDRILIFCHAGCDVKDVCAALGIDVGDLFGDHGHPRKRREIETKINVSDKFENLRNKAFVEMVQFRDEAEAIFDYYKLDIPDEVLPAVHMLPKLNFYIQKLATGSKEEILELMMEGVVEKWGRLSSSLKMKDESLKALACMST